LFRSMVKPNSSPPQLDKFVKLVREKKNVDKNVLKLIDSTILTAEEQLGVLKRLLRDKINS